MSLLKLLVARLIFFKAEDWRYYHADLLVIFFVKKLSLFVGLCSAAGSAAEQSLLEKLKAQVRCRVWRVPYKVDLLAQYRVWGSNSLRNPSIAILHGIDQKATFWREHCLKEITALVTLSKETVFYAENNYLLW